MEYYPIPQSGRFDIEPFPLLELTFGQIVTLDLNEFLTGGAPSVVWSVDGGELPPGVSLTEEGVLSGAATGFGAYVVQVRADAGALGVATQGLGFKLPAQMGDNTVWATGTGGIVTDYSDADGVAWRSHRFTTTGSFIVNTAGVIEWRVTSSGGGAGTATISTGGAGGGGGGGGGTRRLRATVAVGTHPVIIGAGGAAGTNTTNNRHGRRGNVSSFLGIAPPAGGGGAGVDNTGIDQMSGSSGGGARNPNTGGAGTEYFGFKGGDQVIVQVGVSGGAGGGAGAGGPGGVATTSSAAPGGPGARDNIRGFDEHRGGGGAGTPFVLNYGTTTALYTPSLPAGSGGIGGGGDLGQAGQINTGGGGGGPGTNLNNPGNGGSGEVVIRYRRP